MLYLRLMSTAIPALGFAISAWLINFYDLDTAAHNSCLEQIRRREAGEVFEIVDPLAPEVRQGPSMRTGGWGSHWLAGSPGSAPIADPRKSLREACRIFLGS